MGGEPLETFKHPDRAIYILGAEDEGSTQAKLRYPDHFSPRLEILATWYQGGTNVHLSNVHFVLRDISALLDSLGLVIAHFNSFSVEAIERRGGGGGGRRHGREA